VRFLGGALFLVVPPDEKNSGAWPSAINLSLVFKGGWYDLNGTSQGFVAQAIR
jgi:hypothetical protein